MFDDEKKMTPMMEQWHQCKKRAKDAVLLFRMGDFYEAFYEDAELISKELELTLTKRQGIPMSGVPWHAGESYIDRLVSKGYRVAVAEQVEDPKQAKGLVRREIVRYVTPGTVMSSSLLGDNKYNYIGAVTQVGSLFGLATCDLTTATFRVVEIENLQELLNEIFRLNLSELIFSAKFQEKYGEIFHACQPLSFSLCDGGHFEHQMAYQSLTDHFKVAHLDGFGLKGMVAAINSAGALLTYIGGELSLPLSHLKEIKPYFLTQSLLLDRTCQMNLELMDGTSNRAHKSSTLLHVIDQTLTPMGGRLIREWLKKPLLNVEEIKKRQKSITFFLNHFTLLQTLRALLDEVRDLERLAIKIDAGYANPRDVSVFARSLEKIGPLKKGLESCDLPLIMWCQEQLNPLPELLFELKKALVDEPPIRLSEGQIFKQGYSRRLDELRSLMQGGKEWLAHHQSELKERYGIKNLKISYTKVFGYFIEVSRGQAHQMPPTFERRQTLVNCERFISPELKEYESKVLTAEEQAFSLEQELFHELRQRIGSHQETILSTAQAVAHIDAILSLTLIAQKNQYCCPSVDESSTLTILGGRHPVVECGSKETFIPNDLRLDGKREKLMLITGPNMAGKSTYIRQVALIVILAQMGSYVPAQSARIGIIDRIFTRIGANDDLSRGQSTFMVEMSETANILNNLTPRSLVILDEIGRGTSTYDGVSIAWSVAEYLLATEAKTLFATHYWELTELEKKIEGATNYHAAIKEWNEEIIFMHKIVRGAADRSYGIHVARLAGLPPTVIHRANTILKRLEGREKTHAATKKERLEHQLSLF